MRYKEDIKKNFRGINDSTLREGEQYSKANFSLKDQKKILGLLYDIRVDSAEVGNPIVPEIFNDLRKLSKMKKRPLLMAHIRNKKTDLEAAIKAGIDGVHILCASDSSRLKTMRTSLDKHIRDLIENIKLAKLNKIKIRVSVEHGIERRFLKSALKIIKVADSLKVDRVQLADTKGCLFPYEVSDIVKSFRKEIKAEIGVHFHNDLGHAVSNSLEAVARGANWIDTTLLGIGERTGISSLSFILVNLYKIDESFRRRYSLKSISKVERLVAKMVGMEVPHNLITSRNAFCHKAGIHINSIIKQGADTYEIINPEFVGNKRIIVSGSRISGKASAK